MSKKTCKTCYQVFTKPQAYSNHVCYQDAGLLRRRRNFEHGEKRQLAEHALELKELQCDLAKSEANLESVVVYRALNAKQGNCAHDKGWVRGPALTRSSLCSACGLMSSRAQFGTRHDAGDSEAEEAIGFTKFLKKEAKHSGLATKGLTGACLSSTDDEFSSESDPDEEIDEDDGEEEEGEDDEEGGSSMDSGESFLVADDDVEKDDVENEEGDIVPIEVENPKKKQKKA